MHRFDQSSSIVFWTPSYISVTCSCCVLTFFLFCFFFRFRPAASAAWQCTRTCCRLQRNCRNRTHSWMSLQASARARDTDTHTRGSNYFSTFLSDLLSTDCLASGVLVLVRCIAYGSTLPHTRPFGHKQPVKKVPGPRCISCRLPGPGQCPDARTPPIDFTVRPTRRSPSRYTLLLLPLQCLIALGIFFTWSRRGLAWRGVAWRGVAGRGGA